MDQVEWIRIPSTNGNASLESNANGHQSLTFQVCPSGNEEMNHPHNVDLKSFNQNMVQNLQISYKVGPYY